MINSHSAAALCPWDWNPEFLWDLVLGFRSSIPAPLINNLLRRRNENIRQHRVGPRNLSARLVLRLFQAVDCSFAIAGCPSRTRALQGRQQRSLLLLRQSRATHPPDQITDARRRWSSTRENHVHPQIARSSKAEHTLERQK